jgi:L-lactate dehydrogenase complex protein LldE
LSRTAGPIVVPSGSCGDMLVHQYPVLFQDDPEWLAIARAVAARVREFSQFLSEVAPNGVGGTLETRVAYHPSCHLLRGLGVSQQPATQLASISGAQSVPFKDQEECCGFGGLFSIKNADISGRMLARKADAIDACGADRVVSCDLGCLMQIGGGLHRRGSPVKVQHLAQLLDEAQS